MDKQSSSPSETKSKSNVNTKTFSNDSPNDNNFYSIDSIYTSDNQIIIDFNSRINKDSIKFFELNQNPIYKDIFDINGSFKSSNSTKLNIDGINKIELLQNKSNQLRIILSDNRNIKTSYKMKNNQLIISIDDVSTNTSDKKLEQSDEISSSNMGNENVDLVNSINSITNDGNNIIVKFNRDYSKKDVKYDSYKNKDSFENIFEIKGQYKYINPTKLSLDGIDKIITSANGTQSIKIKLINETKPKVNYVLNKRELIISVENNLTEKSSTPSRVINKTIVIDAGHGADDVGAVGPNKRYEKVVNLNVSKYLATILKQRGYKVYLTRTNDSFIKVIDRTVLANEKNADLFISVHTNSVPKEKANEITGIETFFLSPARSERAKRVAALENKSDIREMSDSSKSVFLESLNRPRITASHKFAIDVQAGLLQSTRSKYKDTKDSGVREGPFWVLVGAQMPSILVELGYISHPEESRRLYDSNYQQLLANGIANGIDAYFSKNP